jgi:hypothetical protein
MNKHRHKLFFISETEHVKYLYHWIEEMAGTARFCHGCESYGDSKFGGSIEFTNHGKALWFCSQFCEAENKEAALLKYGRY